MQRLLIVAIFVVRIADASVSYETLYFLNDDGKSYTSYATTRTDEESYEVFLPKGSSLEAYLYIFPNEYRWDTESSDVSDTLQFAQGSYALINQGAFNDKQVTIEDDGTYTLRSWDGTKEFNDHFGYWNDPDDFSNFAIAWVFPEHFELIDYRSNREGDWVQRGNALTFFGYDLNDVTFEMSYRAKTQRTFTALQENLAENVEIEATSEQVRVVLANEILFPSGSVDLSEAGIALLTDLAAQVAGDDSLNVVVEGHTDDVMITGELKERFPTNWELSAKRALNVVHQLASAGIAEARLEARAYGPFRPRMPNTSKANRTANRRIELILIPTN